MTKYVLLMRHGRHEVVDRSQPEQMKLSRDGEQETRAAAERLESWLQELKKDADFAISIGAYLLKCPTESVEDLNPAVFKAFTNTKKHETFAHKIEDYFNANPEHNAVLVIGHQPFLGWFCYTFLGKAIPLDPSELICIAINHKHFLLPPRKVLRWVLSPKDDTAMDEIKEKIKLKMEMQSY